MKYAHPTGIKRERPEAQAWYAAIAAETLRQLAQAEAQGQGQDAKQVSPQRYGAETPQEVHDAV